MVAGPVKRAVASCRLGLWPFSIVPSPTPCSQPRQPAFPLHSEKQAASAEPCESASFGRAALSPKNIARRDGKRPGGADENGMTGLCSNVAAPAAISLCDCGIGRAGALALVLAASNAPGLYRGSLRLVATEAPRCNSRLRPIPNATGLAGGSLRSVLQACPVDRYVRCYRLARWVVTFDATGLPAASLRSQLQACPIDGCVQACQRLPEAKSVNIHWPGQWH